MADSDSAAAGLPISQSVSQRVDRSRQARGIEAASASPRFVCGAGRENSWDKVDQSVFDVAIVGAGINGACLYDHLCRAGYRVLLIDQGDFASGTSQSSAMMIWGGLLYLVYGDVKTVWKLCRSRERMIRGLGEWVKPQAIRYFPAQNGGRSGLFNVAGFYAYWLLGRCRRARPRWRRAYAERVLLNGEISRDTWEYEEAGVSPSDCRFVCEWILPHINRCHVPLNYCRLDGGGYDATAKHWRLELTDTLSGKARVGRARYTINTAGVWTDELNRRFGRESPWRHVFSKGVFIGLERDRRHRDSLIFENPRQKELDPLALIPWGPVSLWGPTETVCEDLQAGFCVVRRHHTSEQLWVLSRAG